MEIRNIAIIAHVDHGKTTLTDALMRQTGAFKEGVSMDSNVLELERGITIYSKNAAIMYKGVKINIVDTPGHVDFGSEVERVLRSIDSVLLVVDAQDGPMPQTRFVLKKSLELGLKPIVVINKIDKPAADPARAEEQVLELFLELGASDEQANFPVVYAIGREGIAKFKLTDESKDLAPLLDMILSNVPCASSEALAKKPLRFQPFNLAYDNFMGRMAVGRVYEGVLRAGEKVFVKKPVLRAGGPARIATPARQPDGSHGGGQSVAGGPARIATPARQPDGSHGGGQSVAGGPNGETRTGKIVKIFTFNGLERIDSKETSAGDIALIAGLPDIDIGETVTTDASADPLPAIAIDEPTITLNFLVNNSPFMGREGKHVTSREIREYLKRELEVNVGLRVDFASTDIFQVYGRGELHIAILLENMRRAGYEIQVSRPQVIIREDNGVKLEPFEEVVIDTPREYQGAIIERLGERAFILQNIIQHGDIMRLTFEGPTRGLLGYKNQFVADTRGEGILSSRVLGFKPRAGEIRKRAAGSMVSMASGKALGYSLQNLQERGALYIGHGAEVYAGMVIGNTSKGDEMNVNPTKGKQLNNVRSSNTDEAIDLTPPLAVTIERGLEIMAEDEYLEITPKSARLRKQYLTKSDREKFRQ